MRAGGIFTPFAMICGSKRNCFENGLWIRAGMGRKEEVCGALTGGILVIGALHGRGEKDDRIATELTCTKTRELIDRFVEKHGTFICRQLLHGIDLTTEEGQKYFKENDLLNKICTPCIHSVVEILEDIA